MLWGGEAVGKLTTRCRLSGKKKIETFVKTSKETVHIFK